MVIFVVNSYGHFYGQYVRLNFPCRFSEYLFIDNFTYDPLGKFQSKPPNQIIPLLSESDGFDVAALMFIFGKTRPNNFLILNLISNSDDCNKGFFDTSCIYYWG